MRLRWLCTSGLNLPVLKTRSLATEFFISLHIDFCRPEPEQPCMGEFHKLFRAPLTFSAPTYVMHLDKEMIRKPLPTANIDLARANDDIITDYLLKLDDSDIVMQVKKHLTEQLPSGKATQDSIARAQNISPRSLQRRLQEASTHYSDVLNDTRRELAIKHISNSRLSIGEITYLLGFAEVNNFSRAFKRWTGQPPSEYVSDQQTPSKNSSFMLLPCRFLYTQGKQHDIRKQARLLATAY